MPRFTAAQLSSFLLVLLVAVPAFPEEKEKLDDKTLTNRLERLVKRGALDKAAALADEQRPDGWCVADFHQIAPFRLVATLGVLARRLDKHATAAQCDVMAVGGADSYSRAGAALYELALVIEELEPAEMDAIGDADTCGVFQHAVQGAFDPWRQTQQSLARKKMSEEAAAKQLVSARLEVKKNLLLTSLENRPNRTVARLLKSNGWLDEASVAEHLRQFGDVAVRTRGPFASEKKARAAMKKEAADEDARTGVTGPTSAAKAEKGEDGAKGDQKFTAQAVRVDHECESNGFLLMKVGERHFFAPLYYDAYVNNGECGGYGSTFSVGKAKWVKPKKIVSAMTEHDDYINSVCGPVGTEKRSRLFCQVGSDGVPRCLNLAQRRDWVSVGDAIDNLDVRRGIAGTVHPDKGVQFKSLTGPPELVAALKRLEGKSIVEVHRAIDPVIDRVAADITPKSKK